MLPDHVLIVGAGVFGLSTAIAIAARKAHTKITIVDRFMPPIPDSASVDTTRCIRSDYDNPIYARLAAKAREAIDHDYELKQHLFEQGMTFVVDKCSESDVRIWNNQLRIAKSQGMRINESFSQEEVFHRIHGKNSKPPSVRSLGGRSLWNRSYSNLDAAFIDAEECIQIYVKRCQQYPAITFRCGSAVDRINVTNSIANGVTLEDGDVIHAGLVVVAAGAWSNRLINIGSRATADAIEVAWIKVTDEEVARWKNMSITTNYTTGFNLFPPYKGEIKILCRSNGYKNTVLIADPENNSRQTSISYPRTFATHPSDALPADAEMRLRQNLREIMPSLAERSFDRTKLCWISRSPTSDFLICNHPRIGGIHLATGGSLHGWKFLPIIGHLILDSIEDCLEEDLSRLWAYDVKGNEETELEKQPQELTGYLDH